MKHPISEIIEIPSGVQCEMTGHSLKCTKSGHHLTKHFDLPNLAVKVVGNQVHVTCVKGNKSDRTLAKSTVAHIKNMFIGLENEYVYQMEAVNVHFPMTMKVDANKLVITNFLGEKQNRFAEIVLGASVELKGPKITIKSRDKEAAGQTMANIEKATKVRKRDRRIFQDGIFLTERPGRAE